jgi:hypothetical protein
MTHALVGHCHCRSINVTFEPSAPLGDLWVRACQCSFCRRHGAMTTSDPAGRLSIFAREEDLIRYQFGTGTADFLLCATCGVFVAAVMRGPAGELGTLNVAGTRMEHLFDRSPEPVSFEGESADQRRTRRAGKWTPTVIVEATPSA